MADETKVKRTRRGSIDVLLDALKNDAVEIGDLVSLRQAIEHSHARLRDAAKAQWEALGGKAGGTGA